jgi:hypothetical protein
MDLTNHIRQLLFEHPDWDKGPARSLFDHHSRRLAELRHHARTRRDLILRTYIYLRDAKHKGFYSNAMMETLWEKVTELAAAPTGRLQPTPSGSVAGEPKCGHCKSKEVHQLLNKAGNKLHCPFKTLSHAKMVLARDRFLELHRATPSGDLEELLATAIAAAS